MIDTPFASVPAQGGGRSRIVVPRDTDRWPGFERVHGIARHPQGRVTADVDCRPAA